MNSLAGTLGFNTEDEVAGVFADEVESVLPQAVKPAPFDEAKNGSISGESYKTVQYEKLVPLLIEAIKELSDKVERLEGGN